MFKGEERHTLTKNTMRHTVGGGEWSGGGEDGGVVRRGSAQRGTASLKKVEDVETSSCITASRTYLTDRRPLRPFPAAATPPYQMSLGA